MTVLPAQHELDQLCGADNWRVFGSSALVYDEQYVYYEIAKPHFWRATADGRPVVALGCIGGRLEVGENPLDCLYREGLEELQVSLQVAGSTSTQLIFEFQLQPGQHTDGDQPLPWFISARSNQLPGAAGDVAYLAVVTYFARALAHPLPNDLFGLLGIPLAHATRALSPEPIRLDTFVKQTAAQLWLNGDLPAEAWLQPILTAELIRRMLAEPTCSLPFRLIDRPMAG